MSSATEQTIVMETIGTEIPVRLTIEELCQLETILTNELCVMRMFAGEGMAPDAWWRMPLITDLLAKIQNANQD